MIHSIKPGVRLTGLSPQMALAFSVACSVYDHHNVSCVLTSACEGMHRRGSLHTVGHAIDLRTRDMDGRSQKIAAETLQGALGDEYDVVLEDDHIHVEWQPKRPLLDFKEVQKEIAEIKARYLRDDEA